MKTISAADNSDFVTGTQTAPASHAATAPVLSLFEIVLAALYGLIALILVLTPPALGLANNGDFRRITTNAGLEQIHDSSFPTTRYVELYNITRISHPDHLNIISRVAVLTPIRIAEFLNRRTSRNTFDLRWLSFVYVLMSTLAMALWVRATRHRPMWQRIIFAAVYAFIFLDLGYLVYFGSFYTEPPSLIYLLCALGCLLNLWEQTHCHRFLRPAWVIGFFLFCTLFAASKAQNGPLIFPLILAGVLAVFWTQSRFIFSLAVVLAILTVGLAVHSVRDYDINLRNQNSINTVFNGLLVESPDRKGDLQKLGLRPEWADFAGHSQFTADSPFTDPTFKEEYFKRITPGKVAVFYIKHPSRLIPPLTKAAASLFDVRLTYGNFTKKSDISAKAIWNVHSSDDLPSSSRWKWPLFRAFMVWSPLKASILPGKIWFWLLTGFMVGGVGIAQAIKCKNARDRVAGAALFSLALMFLLIPPICIAGDGTWEINKHLFLGCVVFDLMLLLLLDAIMSLVSGKTEVG